MLKHDMSVAFFVSLNLMGKTEIFFGAFLMTVSVIVFALTFQFPQQTIALPPTIFPRFVSTCLFVLAMLLSIQGWLGVKQGLEGNTAENHLTKGFFIRLVVLIILAFVYIQILPLAGYLLATPPFIAVTMLTFNEKRWIWIVAVSLITSVLLYVLFRMLFRVPLPRLSVW